MPVTQLDPRILVLEYRPESDVESYFRFYFNLDRYELSVISNWGGQLSYKWTETPDTESFLALMVRIDGDYLINKLYGPPSLFDYNATVKEFLEQVKDQYAWQERYQELVNFFELNWFASLPDTFVSKVSKNFPEFDSEELWNAIRYSYPEYIPQLKEVFVTEIQPYIKANLLN